MSHRLVVFAKTPRPGHVKTRLCPPLSAGQAAGLCRAFLLDVLELCDGLPDCERVLAYAPRGTRAEMAALAGVGWRLTLQQGQDLGERLANAFEEALAAAPRRVLIIGTDSPHLSANTLRAADTALSEADVVLGPCADGGFYLIGLRRWQPGLLDGVRWSTEHALRDTLACAAGLGLSCHLLEESYDVDDFASLMRLADHVHGSPASRLRHTRQALAAMDLEALARQTGRPEAP